MSETLPTVVVEPAPRAIGRPEPTPGIILRSLVFTAFLYLSMAVAGLVFWPVLLGPRAWAVAVARSWSASVMWGLKAICGVSIELRGLEYMPREGGFIAAKHFAMLDTIAPLVVLPDSAYVIKKELMKLPFWGWYVAKLDMLPIDRAGGSATLRAMVSGAQERMAAGRQILIFPEGTRKEPGEAPDYKPGVAGLYRELEVPCTLMATNSGLCWPAHGYLKFPGKVVFEFLPAIEPGLKRGAFMKVLEERLEAATDKLLVETR